MASLDVHDDGAGPPGAGGDGRPSPVRRLLDLLDLDEVGPDRYVGRTPPPALGPPRLFGGQVAAQAQRAAALTVRSDHHVHSVRAYFLRAGRHGPPITFTVDRLRDGRSFSTRRVVAVQGDDAILSLDASFHRDEPGDAHRPPSPVDRVPPPEDGGPPPVPPWAAGIGRASVAAFLKERPVEMRHAGRASADGRAVWVRVPEPVGDDPGLHAALLTYLCDMGPVGAVASALGQKAGALMMASLDHNLWFHDRARADEWLLYDLVPVAAGHGRGLARGAVWTRDGRLVATVVQEVLARPRHT